MQKDYYRWYYEIERKHWWFKVRNEIILGLAKKNAAGRKLNILNVGVATGYTTEMLAEFGEVTSVEYDKDCYNFLQTFLKGKLINGSITELPFADNTFDLVCAFDVVEHVKEDALAVSEMNRVCNKEGLIFVTVPAFLFLWSAHDVVNHHITRYRLPQLLALFAGNKIVYATYFNFLLFPPIAFFRILKTWISGVPDEENAESDFKSVKPTLSSKLLESIFSIERWFINKNIKMPFGVSILVMAKKNDKLL